jgi:hypothetical protein
MDRPDRAWVVTRPATVATRVVLIGEGERRHTDDGRDALLRESVNYPASVGVAGQRGWCGHR